MADTFDPTFDPYVTALSAYSHAVLDTCEAIDEYEYALFQKFGNDAWFHKEKDHTYDPELKRLRERRDAFLLRQAELYHKAEALR